MTGPRTSLTDAALSVLTTADADAKAAAALAAGERFAALGPGDLASPAGAVPDRPARPERPELLAPKDMERRRIGGERGKFALLHALAHIELNAIDLAFDMIARFGPVLGVEHDFTEAEAQAFATDWLSVGTDEARHFRMLEGRMQTLGCRYGDFPAHDGLWQAAQDTSDDLLARLAVVPMVLEARGLDVTPTMIAKLDKMGDTESARILKEIYRDEIGHVSIGTKWFDFACAKSGKLPKNVFHALVRSRFHGRLKEPFNEGARAEAGMPPEFYRPLA